MPPSQTLLVCLGLALWSIAASPASADPYPNHRELMVFANEAGKIQPVQEAADWQRRRGDILTAMQRVMGPLPSREGLPPFNPKITETTEGEGFTRQTILLTVEPGNQLPVDLYLPRPLPNGEKRPAILALHSTGRLGKRIAAGDGDLENRAYAVELAQRGYVVIAPDYPSFGDAADYDFNQDRYESGTMKGIFNHIRCLDYLETLEQVDGERLGAIGHSLGGHNAMFVAAFDPRIKVIVSSCGWTPFHDYYVGNLTGWTSDRYMPKIRDVYGSDPDRMPFDFYEVIAALAPRPFFSNSPVSDENFDVAGVRKGISEARKVYDLLGVGDQLILKTPDCGHDFPEEMREAAYRLFDATLRNTRP
ncbi:MAG: alpha/beta fold hydrolase [Pirellulaceae bacterium]